MLPASCASNWSRRAPDLADRSRTQQRRELVDLETMTVEAEAMTVWASMLWRLSWVRSLRIRVGLPAVAAGEKALFVAGPLLPAAVQELDLDRFW